MRAAEVDPITLAVVGGGFESAIKEMTAVVERTARSPVVAIGRDFSNAIYTTANGVPEMVVQGADQPVHLGGMLMAVKDVAERLGDDIHTGDVIIRNQPWSGASHLIDIDVIAPVFFEAALIGWACSRAHMGDVGGPVPGGYNPRAEDIFGEGIIIPPVKLFDAGVEQPDIWRLILANVRLPELVAGDLGAQLSAVRLAGRRIQAVASRYGHEVLGRAAVELLDRAERLMRAQIAAMPDGTVCGSSWIQDDGHGSGDREIKCAIHVRGTELEVEIERLETCTSYRNSYGGVTRGAVYFAVLSAIEPGLPINEGLYRPIGVELGPEGSMLNALPPAACAMSTGDVWENVFDAVCDALSRLVPQRACAGWAHVAINSLSGVDPRSQEPYGGLLHISYQGGAGAAHRRDGGGLWGSIAPGGAASVGDIELLELRLPVHFAEHELRQDSGCPGRFRGAPGATVDLEIVDHNAVAVHLGDGTKFPSPSRLGGGSVRDAELRTHRKWIERTGGHREDLPLHSVVRLERNEHLRCLTAGGGGIESPFERDPEAVAADVRAELVSVSSARSEYGVELEPESCRVDLDATARLRARRG
jgi:N-methylhydantoinase B